MYRRNYYNNKIHTDNDFYQQEKKRVVEYQINRYKNDEEYKQMKKDYARNYYIKKKELSKTI
jgi:hypothetical protein